MSLFNFARTPGFPTQYEAQFIAAHTENDVLIAGLILSLVIVGISGFAILPAYNKKKRWALFLRIFTSLLLGGIVLVGNFGHSWEIGKVYMSSPYKPSSHEEIEGSITLHVALRGINITLKGMPVKHETSDRLETSLIHERIDYNEHFSWEWAQGRLGFGYYAGQISKDFRAASERGIPLPILQIAEYFTFDGEGLRFGRYYRLAGWYAHILMWCALVTFVIGNILLCMIVSSAAYFLVLTGLLQLASIAVWTFLRNPIEIQIPFQSQHGDGDVILQTRFGPDYYLVLANGAICTLLGLIIIGLDSFIPDTMCQIFGIDPLTIYDEFHLSKTEIENAKKDVSGGKRDGSMMEMGVVSKLPSPTTIHQPKKVSFYGSIDENDVDTDDMENTVVLKRRSNVTSKLFQRSFRVKPRPFPRVSKPSTSGIMQPDAVKPLLGRGRNIVDSSSDDEGVVESWPPPPRDSVLKRPPTPPPKNRR